MIIGVLKELKIGENRVGLVPSFVNCLTKQGHEVIVEASAGIGSGFSDEDYLKAGAAVFANPSEIWERADFIVKVKEPVKTEYDKLRENQVLFTYLHLAPNKELTDALMSSGSVCIAYETVTDSFGRLPLLSPMSTIAGRMSIFVASNLLQKQFGGRGVLPCGVPGVMPSKVTILGGGCVGMNAAYIAHGIGADVTVFDNYQPTLDKIHDMFRGQVKTAYSTKSSILDLIVDSDIVIGAALIPGDSTPKIISRDMVKEMKKGSVIIDVSIDQGGCSETSYPTSHEDPYYEVSGVLHYSVTNMPGAYSRTSTISLNNATFPFIEKIANLGYMKALKLDGNLKNGLNVFNGKITNRAVAKYQNRQFFEFEDI